MKIILKSSIYFFDIIDKFIHQKSIINFFKRREISISNFIDVGSHKGLYTDLFLKNIEPNPIPASPPSTLLISAKLKYIFLLFV